MSTASRFEELALEALPEVLDELGYPQANRGRLCDWFDFPESLPIVTALSFVSTLLMVGRATLLRVPQPERR